jgi:hypothetical protein
MWGGAAWFVSRSNLELTRIVLEYCNMYLGSVNYQSLMQPILRGWS